MEVAWDGTGMVSREPAGRADVNVRQRGGEGEKFAFESHGYGAVACATVIDGTRLSRSKGRRPWIRGDYVCQGWEF